MLASSIMTTTHTRDASAFPGDFVAFMAPFLVQIVALPAWALARLPDSSLQRFPDLLAAVSPLLLVPALVVASAVYWRRKPGSGCRLNIFAGTAAGAASITAFFHSALSIA